MDSSKSSVESIEQASSFNSQGQVSLRKFDAPFKLDPKEPLFVTSSLVTTRKLLVELASSTSPTPDISINQALILEKELSGLKHDLIERLAFLQARTQMLKSWIAENFNVHDISLWISEQKKRKEERASNDRKESTIALSGNEEKLASLSNGGASTTTTTTLRLKLGILKEKETSSGNSNTHSMKPTMGTGGRPGKKNPLSSPQQLLARGAGNKNLSRMNRPKEGKSDGSKPKVPNQTPINTFWNYVEACFKNIEETDLKYLDDSAHVVDPTPFTIPSLGTRYEIQWFDQYGYIVDKGGISGTAGGGLGGIGSGNSNINHGGILFDGKEGQIGSNDKRYRLALPNVQSTNLRDRLLSMLIEEKVMVPENDANFIEEEYQEEPIMSQHDTLEHERLDYLKVEDRIRQELFGLGFEEFSNLQDFREDDLICVEMRKLQTQLRDQVCINHYRKALLANLIKSRLPAQEFYSLLHDLDKQIELLYQRRSKSSKKRKKHSSTNVSGPSNHSSSLHSPTISQSSTSTGTKESTSESEKLLETRSKLISSFSPFTPSLRETLSPVRTKLFIEEEEAKVLCVASKSGNWLPIPTRDPLTFRPTQPVFPQ